MRIQVANTKISRVKESRLKAGGIPGEHPADLVGFERIQHFARIAPACDARYGDPELARVMFRGRP